MVDEVKLDDTSDLPVDYAPQVHLLRAESGGGGEVPLGRLALSDEPVCKACQIFARIADSELRGDLASILEVRKVCAVCAHRFREMYVLADTPEFTSETLKEFLDQPIFWTMWKLGLRLDRSPKNVWFEARREDIFDGNNAGAAMGNGTSAGSHDAVSLALASAAGGEYIWKDAAPGSPKYIKVPPAEYTVRWTLQTATTGSNQRVIACRVITTAGSAWAAPTARHQETELELKAYNSSARSIPSGLRPGARKLLLPDGAHRLQVDGTLGSVTVEAADGHGAMPVTALQFVVGSVGDVREMRAGPDAVKKVLRTLVVMPS